MIRSNVLGPMIVVLNALDVVFAEIASGLHLDQFQIDLAGILKTVIGADQHIDRFPSFHGGKCAT